MRCERFTLHSAGEATELAQRIRRLVPAPESVRAAVAEIIETVKRDGDDALIEYTRRFDTGGGKPAALTVSGRELEAAGNAADSAIVEGLKRAIDNVTAVAEASFKMSQ